ncbi:MAG: hypothetical protein RL660_139 [Bacteroidota bacterium]|jgi:hypothetical protein
MEINKENIEEYILLLVDGELDGKTQAVVLQYINTHADADSLYKEYMDAKFVADEQVVFPAKMDLLAIANTEIKAKRFFSIKRVAAIAAMLCIAIGSYLLLQSDPQSNDSIVDTNGKSSSQPSLVIDSSVEQVTVSNNTENLSPAATQNATSTSKKSLFAGLKNSNHDRIIAKTNDPEQPKVKSIASANQVQHKMLPGIIADRKKGPFIISNEAISIPVCLGTGGIPVINRQLSRTTLASSISQKTQASYISKPSTTVTSLDSDDTQDATAANQEALWYDGNNKFLRTLAKASKQAEGIWASAVQTSKEGLVVEVDYSKLLHK